MPPKGNNSNKKKKGKSKKRFSSKIRSPFTPEEQHELAALITPFAQESVGARICDDKASLTTGITLHTDYEFTADASGLMQVQLAPYWGTRFEPYIIQLDGAAPAASELIHPHEYVAYEALSGSIRVVGCALKVSSTDPELSKQGRCTVGLVPDLIQTGAATFSTFATTVDKINNPQHYNVATPDDGCQVRWQPTDEDDLVFHRMGDGVLYARNNLQNLPVVCISNLVQNQVIHAEAVIHMEYVPSGLDILVGTPSPYGAHHGAIMAVAARAPISASGHSFIKWVNIALSAARVMQEILKVGVPLATTIAPMVAGMF